jgi:hypothetical protein
VYHFLLLCYVMFCVVYILLWYIYWIFFHFALLSEVTCVLCLLNIFSLKIISFCFAVWSFCALPMQHLTLLSFTLNSFNSRWFLRVHPLLFFPIVLLVVTSLLTGEDSLQYCSHFLKKKKIRNREILQLSENQCHNRCSASPCISLSLSLSHAELVLYIPKIIAG